MSRALFIIGGATVGWLAAAAVGGIVLAAIQLRGTDPDPLLVTVLGGLWCLMGIIWGGLWGGKLADGRRPVAAAETGPPALGPLTSSDPSPGPRRTAPHRTVTRRAPSVPSSTTTNPHLAEVQQLQALGDMCTKGVLTREEFDAARERLLGRGA